MFASLAATAAAGFGIGVATELIPGPITVLIIVESIKQGWRAGVATAAAAPIVDAAVMIPLALLLRSLTQSRGLQVVFGVAGTLFLIYLGIDMLLTARRGIGAGRDTQTVSAAASFRRAVGAHLLSPLAYSFWGTVGVVMFSRAFASGGIAAAVAFPLGFWTGTAAVAAFLITAAHKGRNLLGSKGYQAVVAAGGVAMIGLAGYLAWRVAAG
jgi:threonine/homoserine/homoserine lactone efflux protein